MPAVSTMTAILAAVVALQPVISAVGAVLVSMLISSVFKPKTPGIEVGPLSSPLAAGGAKRVVFGLVGVRAVRLIANQRVDQTHHWVAAISDWPVDAIEGVLIRGEPVELDADGWVTSEPWGEAGARTIRFRFWDGSQTEPLDDLIAAGLVEDGAIGVSTAIVWASINVPQSQGWIRLFQGAVPDFVFRVRGAKVYDPTDAAQTAEDASTWKWAREAILVQAFHQVCALGRGRPVSEIDWDQVAAILPRHRAAITSKRGDVNPRFCADGVWYCVDETHSDVESRIATAHAGGLIDMAASSVDGAGALQKFYTSDASAAAAAVVKEADIGPGGATISDTGTLDSKPNTIRISFPNASRLWERYTLEVSDADAVSEDGEVRAIVKSIDTVTNHAQAAMLGLLDLRRQRNGRTISGTFATRLLPIRSEDHVSVKVDDWALDGTSRWRVEASGMDEKDMATLVLGLDDVSWHADAGDLEPDEIEIADEDGDDSALPAPTVTVTSGSAAAVQVGGVILPGVKILVEGDAGIYRVALVSVSYSNGSDDVVLTGTIQLEGAESGSLTLGPIPAGVIITWVVEVQDYQSDPASVTGTHTIVGDLVAPGVPSPFSATLVDGSNIFCQATAPSDADVQQLRFITTIPPAVPTALDFVAGGDGVVACLPSQTVSVTLIRALDSEYSVWVAAVDSSGNVGSRPSRIFIATDTPA